MCDNNKDNRGNKENILMGVVVICFVLIVAAILVFGK